MAFSPGSRGRLTEYHLGRFPADTLFDRIGRAVCAAGCLPRKELYQAWEVARRARRLFRGGRVVDLGSGHGLLAQVMLLLDDSSSVAVAVDAALPPSAPAVHEALVQAWPRLEGRVTFVKAALEDVPLTSEDVVVSSHACGALTDTILARATEARARVAVLPCCHDVETCEAGPFAGWVDLPLAIDLLRAVRLEQQGYRVWTQSIPAAITPKNRLLLGAPRPIDRRRPHAPPLLADEVRAEFLHHRRSSARQDARAGKACGTTRRATSCATRCRRATACCSMPRTRIRPA